MLQNENCTGSCLQLCVIKNIAAILVLPGKDSKIRAY